MPFDELIAWWGEAITISHPELAEADAPPASPPEADDQGAGLTAFFSSAE